MFNYLTYRIFDFFYKDNNEKAVSKTVNFIVLLEGSLIVPIFMLINALGSQGSSNFGGNSKLIYLIGIPLAEILILLHSTIVKRKLTFEHLDNLDDKYYRKKHKLPMLFILAAPLFFIFVIPVALSGVVSFHFIENLWAQPLWM